jgi:hypothetical protein
MAYTRRKEGYELWKPGALKDYGFCLCCKGEVAPEENGWVSTRRKVPGYNPFLCISCIDQWKQLEGRLSDIPRFKKQ